VKISLTEPIFLVADVKEKLLALLQDKKVDEAVKVLIEYLARQHVVIYEQPKAVIYKWDVSEKIYMVLIFTGFVVHLKDEWIYIKPWINVKTRVKLSFED